MPMGRREPVSARVAAEVEQLPGRTSTAEVSYSSFASEQVDLLTSDVVRALPEGWWDRAHARYGGRWTGALAVLRDLAVSVPDIRAALATCSAAASTAAVDVPLQPGDDDAVAASVVLAHGAIAMYGTIFETLLSTSLLIEESSAYWAHLKRVPRAAAYELLHTNPFTYAHRRYAKHLEYLDQSQRTVAWSLGLLATCTRVFTGATHDDLLARTVSFLEVLEKTLCEPPPDERLVLANGDPAVAKEAPSVEAAEVLIVRISDGYTRLQTLFESLERAHRPPSTVQQLWIPAVVGTGVVYYGTRYLSHHQMEFRRWAQDAWYTVARFAVQYLYKPVEAMYQTVRYDQHQLAVIRAEALQADVDSLERMVLQFAHDRLSTPPDELAAVARQTAVGDISIVMRPYEEELRHPLKSFLVGDLARLMLIQVQKTKVDVEVAMAALDKLLKANELNFTLLTLIPAVVLVTVLVVQLRRLARRRRFLSSGDVYRTLRNQLWLVEVLLNDGRAGRGSEEPLTILSQGYLLIQVHLLRELCNGLSAPDMDLFIADLRKLEHPALSAQQRLMVISRMHRTFPHILHGPSAAGGLLSAA